MLSKKGDETKKVEPKIEGETLKEKPSKTKDKQSSKGEKSNGTKKLSPDETVVEDNQNEEVLSNNEKEKKKVSKSTSDLVDNSKKEKEGNNKANEKKHRNPTGYNIFMKEKMSEIVGDDQKSKLKSIASLWRDLSVTEKEKYNEEALKHKKVFKDNQDNESKKKGKNISGYTLFMKDLIKTIEAGSQKEKMIEVAKLWKEESQDTKNKYNEKAKKIKEESQSQEE